MRKSELRRIIREEISKLNEAAVGGIIRYDIKLDRNKYSRRDALKMARLLADEGYTRKGRMIHRRRDEHPNENTFHDEVGTVAVFSDDFFETWYFVEMDDNKQRPTM